METRFPLEANSTGKQAAEGALSCARPDSGGRLPCVLTNRSVSPDRVASSVPDELSFSNLIACASRSSLS